MLGACAARVSRRRSAGAGALMLLALGGCGHAAFHHGRAGTTAGQAAATLALVSPGATAQNQCAATVLDALGHVAHNVYAEALASNTTRTAFKFVARSSALRTAVAAGNPAAARAAIASLQATGHVGRLQVVTGVGTLADVGPATALAPLHGTLAGVAGDSIASYTLSVQTVPGYISATRGLTSSDVVVSAGGRELAGTLRVRGRLPPSGTVAIAYRRYRVYTFAGNAFSGAPLEISLLRRPAAARPDCGASVGATLARTLGHAALRIYHEEVHSRELDQQVLRVERDPALLRAVAARNRPATRAAIDALLNQHIVRLRVQTPDGRLLSDVGGRYVLAPTSGPLRVRGRTVGRFTLSIQDDLGFLLLSQRLLGVDVVIQRNGREVMSTLPSPPRTLPSRGQIVNAGRAYQVYYLPAKAFPSGPLRIWLLVGLPYAG